MVCITNEVVVEYNIFLKLILKGDFVTVRSLVMDRLCMMTKQ